MPHESPILSSLPASSSPPNQGPPPDLSIRPVDKPTLPLLSSLNALLLPVTYPKRFYSRLLDVPTCHGLLAFHPQSSFGRPVGACCAEELSEGVDDVVVEWAKGLVGQIDAEEGVANGEEGIELRMRSAEVTWVYIQTLCVLSPFRGLGVATALLRAMLDTVGLGKQKNTKVGIYAHVHVENEDALAWYEKRGFVRVRKIEKYYRRLQNCDAWMIAKVEEV